MEPKVHFPIRCMRFFSAPLLLALILRLCGPGCGFATDERLSLAGGLAARRGDNATLEERWREFRKSEGNDFRAAIAAAEDMQMPSQRCAAKLFHGKTRTNAAGDWKVRWLNAQRRAAADLGHLFEIRWDGPADAAAIPKHDVEDLFASLAELAAGGTLRFTWALSRSRLVAGIVDDIVELGVGHVNLVTSTDEEVFIAGEGGMNLPSEASSEPGFVVNFLSGTFTHPIVRKYLPGHEAHQEQWAPLMAEVFSVGGIPARVALLDHNNGPQHFVGGNGSVGVARQARILADSQWPTERTKRSVCSPAEGLEWLRHCVCRLANDSEGAEEQRWHSWCDEGEPCSLERCSPSTGFEIARDL